MGSLLCCCCGEGNKTKRSNKVSAHRDIEFEELPMSEALKYDKNFKGPLSKRSCTDVFCLIIFVIFLVCWGGIAKYAIKNGDLDRLLVPTDTEGRKCGVDNEVVHKPYLVFFNLEKCIDPAVPLYGCKTPQVCVEQCPTTSFVFVRNQCNDNNLYEIRKQLICKMDVNIDTVRSCDEIERLVHGDQCARWYLRSDSFLKRCISGLPSNNCPLIPRHYLQQHHYRRIRRSLPMIENEIASDDSDQSAAAALLRHFDASDAEQLHHLRMRRSNLTTFDDLTIMDQRRQEEPEAQCEERRQVGQQILIEKVNHFDSMLSRFVGNFILHFSNSTQSQEMGQMIVEDVIASWTHILTGLLISMFSCLVIIAVLRWLATPLVWLSISGVITLLGFGTYYTLKRYLELKNGPPRDTVIITTLEKFGESWLQKKETWLYSCIALGIALVVILLIVLVLRRRIVIAIALVKEGSKAVSSIYSTVFFPIFPWILQIAILAFAVVIGLYLQSVGDPVNQVIQMDVDRYCICTGPAITYRNGEICDPRIFNQYCYDSKLGAGRACETARCHFKEIQSPKIVTYFQAANIFGFFWTMFFVTALGEMVLAATFATWYWTFHKSDVPYFTLSVGLTRTIRYHLGTIAFGSLIISICRIIRVILEYFDRQLKKYDNELTRCILCCLKCFFWCLEKFLRFINKNAYIMCAIHGKGFCTSARDAFNLLMRNFLRVIALDQVTEFLFFLAKVLVTMGMGAATYLYFTSDKVEHHLHYVQVPVVIVMVGTYLIASVFFGVYSMAVDTLFMCFLEDCERNDGSAEKPYFMSKQLMKILGKKNLIPRDQYQ